MIGLIGLVGCTLLTLPATTGAADAGPGGALLSARTTRPGAVPGTSCPLFPANNYWRTSVTGLRVSSRSAAWLSHIGTGGRLHPDFGPSFGEIPVPYGIGVTVVTNRHATYPVSFYYPDESDHVRYPLGPDTFIEGGRSSDGDRHAVILNRDTCRLYETYDTHGSGSHWTAGSGATWDLRSNRLRPREWTSADAAGLPILAGLLTYDEVRAGAVTHAIRFTAPVTQDRYIWPARHHAGATLNKDYPPMGARFRLKASFSLQGWSRDARVVLQGMKKYGLVLADNGSAWYFQGTADSRWPITLIDELKRIPARAFEAVDTAPMMISPDSGQARQP